MKRMFKRGDEIVVNTTDLLPQVNEKYEMVAEEDENGNWNYVVFKEHLNGEWEMEEEGWC